MQFHLELELICIYSAYKTINIITDKKQFIG